jgi:hypothetical protein
MQTTTRTWFKTKYYPVDPTRKVIYNDPQPRERDCSFGEKYNLGTVGIKGSRLNQYASKYAAYEVLPPVRLIDERFVQAVTPREQLPDNPRIVRDDDGKVVQVERTQTAAPVPADAPSGEDLIEAARQSQSHPLAKLLNGQEAQSDHLRVQLRHQRTRTEVFRRACRFYHCILRVATQINDDLYTRVGELERQLTDKQKQVDALEARLAEKERLEQSLQQMQAQLNAMQAEAVTL